MTTSVYQYLENLEKEVKDEKTDLYNLKKKAGLELFGSEQEERKLNFQEKNLRERLDHPVQALNSTYFEDLNQSFRLLFWGELFFVLLLSYYLFFDDMERGILGLFQSTRKGLKSLFWTKLGVLLVTIVLMEGVFFGLNQLLLGLTTPLSSPLRSMSSYLTAPLHLTLKEFFLQMALYRMVLLFGLALFFTLLLILLKSPVTATVPFVAYLVLTLLSFLFVVPGSMMEWTKYLGPYQVNLRFLKMDRWIWLFGRPLLPDQISLLFFALMCLVCFIPAYLLYQQAPKGKRKRRAEGTSLKTTNLWVHSLRDLYWEKKGVFLILALVFFLIFQLSQFNYVRSAQDEQRESFRRPYYGQITEDKLKEIDEEIQSLSPIVERRQKLISKLNQTGHLSEEEGREVEETESLQYRMGDLEELKSEMEEIRENGGKHLVNRSPVNHLHATNARTSLILQLVLQGILVSLVIAAVVSPRYQRGLEELYRTTKQGIEVRRILFTLLYLFSLLLFVLLFAERYLEMRKVYSDRLMNVPLNVLFDTSLGLSYYGYLGILGIFLLLYLFFQVSLGYYLSVQFSSTVSAMLQILVLLTSMILFGIHPVLGPMAIFSYQILEFPLLLLGLLVLFIFLGGLCYRKVRDS